MMHSRHIKGRRRSPLAPIAVSLAAAILITGCSKAPTSSSENLTWEAIEDHLMIYASGTLSTSWGRSFEWEGTEYRTTYLIGAQLSGVSDEVFRRHASTHIKVEAESAFRIGNQCFQGTQARCIDLSQTAVDTIGCFCFANTPNLEEAHLPSTIKVIGEGAFDSSGVQKIYWYGTRNEWEAVDVQAGNETLNAIEMVFVPEQMVFDEYSGNAYFRVTDETLEIVCEGAYVGGSAGRAHAWHYLDQKFSHITIGGSTTYMSAYAFANKELESVSILPSTFSGCGMGLFAGSSIDRVDLQNTSLTELKIDTFYQARVGELFLPSTLKRIGSYCFEGSSIDSVFFEGTKEEWQAIEVGENNDSVYNARIVCLEDGTVIE